LLKEQDALDAKLCDMRWDKNSGNAKKDDGNKQKEDDNAQELEEVEEGHEMDHDGKEKVDLSDSDEKEEDLVESQSSVSMGTQVDNIKNGRPLGTRKMTVVSEAVEDEDPHRFSDRLASKNNDDVPILERAKNRVKAKNLIVSEGTHTPTVLNSGYPVIMDVAELVGIELGSSLEMIENNLDMLMKQEQARFNIFAMSNKNDEEQESVVADALQIDFVDTVL
jgi:hypothetical protein